MKLFTSIAISLLVSQAAFAAECGASLTLSESFGKLVKAQDIASCEQLDFDFNDQQTQYFLVGALENGGGCQYQVTEELNPLDLMISLQQDFGPTGSKPWAAQDILGLLTWIHKNHATIYTGAASCYWSSEQAFAIVDRSSKTLINFSRTFWSE